MTKSDSYDFGELSSEKSLSYRINIGSTAHYKMESYNPSGGVIGECCGEIGLYGSGSLSDSLDNRLIYVLHVAMCQHI